MSPEREFVEQLKDIRDFWVKEGNTKEDVADGIMRSILSMIDGDIGINNYHKLGVIDYTEGKLINGGDLLSIYRGEVNE